MPTRLTTHFPPLKDSVEFESLVRDICALEWDDPFTDKFGRSGQKQYGVDIYGRPVDLGGKYRAAQCKLRTTEKKVTKQQIEAEIAQAKQSPFELETLIIATDAPRDAKLQTVINRIGERELNQGGFRVVIWFWDNITEKLAAYPRLIVRYYADYFASLTSLPIVERLIETPLQVISIRFSTLSKSALLDDALSFRGIRVLEYTQTTGRKHHILNDILPDGVVFHYQDINANEIESTAALYANSILNSLSLFGNTCPAFVILPATMTMRFLESIQSVGGISQQISIVSSERSTNEVADQILETTLQYGYERRGGIPTMDIAVRTRDNKPRSVFLDIDWRTRLNTNSFPTHEEWDSIFIPSLMVVRNQLLSQIDNTRIQIDCQLPLPAAIALGFFFNIRVAKVGVWARRTGVSDFKQQFWLSDGEPANTSFKPEWIRPLDESSRSAIMELTSYVSIHKAVEEFINMSGTDYGGWLEMGLNRNGEPLVNIDESNAVAYADQVGKVIRNLNEKGVTDIHLFARIPSSLGVLIGQRLQACGRIHLYWFKNPSYQYAFTLK